MPHVIEIPVRFSTSRLWQLQLDYYQNLGPSAWSKKLVPFRITTNNMIATHYAQVVMGFLRDIKANRMGKFDPKKPIPIVEIGAGSGRLAFLLVRAIKQLQSLDPDLKALKFLYVATDAAASNVSTFNSQPQLAQLANEGLLDFAVFNAAQDTELTLVRAKKKLSAITANNPLVLIANYALDVIAHDAFEVKNGVLSELKVGLLWPGDEGDKWESDPKRLDKIQLPTQPAPISGKFYSDPAYQLALNAHASALKNAQFLFPVAGLNCIDRMAKLGGGRLLCLIADMAYSRITDYEGMETLPLAINGSFSTRVNLTFYRQVLAQKGGVLIARDSANTRFDCYAAIIGKDHGHWHHTRNAIREQLLEFGPQDFFNLYSKLIENPPTDFGGLIGLINLCRHDIAVTAKVDKQLLEMVNEIRRRDRPAVTEALLKAWDNNYQMADPFDYGFLFGKLFRRLGDPEKAVEFYRHSISQHGEHPVTYYNIGLCCQQFSDKEQARSALERCLQLDPNYEQARDLLKNL